MALPSSMSTSQIEKPLQPSKYDLSTNEGMLAYLNKHTAFSTSSVTRLSGGHANWTYRATLDAPYTLVGSSNQQNRTLETIVVKFSGDVAAAYGGVSLDLYRTKAEIAALKLVSGLDLPHFGGMGITQRSSSSSIFLPGLISYDTTNNVGFYVDLGPLPTLKQYLIDHPGPDTIDIAIKAGELLGQFLAGLHLWGYKTLHDTATSNVLDIFQQIESTKQICVWRTIGFVESSAKEYRIDADWEKITDVLKREVLESNDTLNMGDFWTGNVLIELESSTNSTTLKALHVLDWEMAKTGSASTDIAQLAAEAFMLRQFSNSQAPSSSSSSAATTSDVSPSGEALLVSFLDSYEGYIKKVGSQLNSESGRSIQDVLLDSRSVIGHLCAHVATIGKSVSWAANKETTEKAVRSALRLMITNDQSDTTNSLKEVLTALRVK